MWQQRYGTNDNGYVNERKGDRNNKKQKSQNISQKYSNKSSSNNKSNETHLGHRLSVILLRREAVQKNRNPEFFRQPGSKLFRDFYTLVDGHVLNRNEGTNIQGSHSGMLTYINV